MIGSYEAIIQTNLPFVTSTNHSTHYAVSRYSFAPSQFKTGYDANKLANPLSLT